MKRIYAAFLRLYPREYRDLFGPEVLAVFAQAADDRRRCGQGAFLRFLMIELSGAVASAARCWIHRLSLRERSSPEIAGNRTHLFSSVEEAQNLIELNIKRMTHAIANHDFVGARQYSFEERKAREELHRLRDLYGLGDDDQLTLQ